jgi:K+/H+ antiporter YhaU regulatory subunit KhtT
MHYLKSLQISRAYNLISVLMATAILITVAGQSKAANGENNTLWQYNDKKTEEPMNLESMPDRIKEVKNTLNEFQNQLAVLLNKCESLNSADPELQQAIKKIGEKYETKRKNFEDIEKQIADLEAALKSKSANAIDKDQSIEELKAKLKQGKDKYSELLQKKSKSAADANDKGVPSFVKLDGVPVIISIYNNKIIPFDEPYYKSETVWYQGQGCIAITRVLEGQSVQEAIAPNGYLGSILSDADIKNKYIRFAVCQDSIPAFLIAAKKVQDANVHYSWTPNVDKPIAIPISAINSNSESNIFGK